MKRIFFLFLLIGAACTSVEPVSNCASEVSQDRWTALDQTQLQKDIDIIDDYLFSNGITAVEHPSGVRYVVNQFGSGDNIPCLESLISITYEGRILGNGTLFETGSKPTALILNQRILGWQIALLELNKGTKVTLYIPSGLGYGTQHSTLLPANSNLIFQIELLDFR
jgi:FKBP-type peptidyl-prolyl cis-trans isomerase